MLERLPRPLALLVLGLLLLAAAWCFVSPPQAPDIAEAGGYTDLQLFTDITARTAAGVPYHQAAAEVQRAHAYPLRPFITMRQPALYVLAARLGWGVMQDIALALALVALMLWTRALLPIATPAERISAILGLTVGALPLTSQGLLVGTEPWLGLLLTLALACRFRGWEWGELACVAAALVVRELALPYALLALAFALLQRQRTSALRWLGVIALFGVAMAIHGYYAAAVVRPDDFASPGWTGGQGLRGFLMGVAYVSIWQNLPQPIALLLALLPALGWMALSGRTGLYAQLLLGGYALMLMLFARSDNFYWGFTVMPLWFIGYALIPRALGQLRRAILQG